MIPLCFYIKIGFIKVGFISGLPACWTGTTMATSLRRSSSRLQCEDSARRAGLIEILCTGVTLLLELGNNGLACIDNSCLGPGGHGPRYLYGGDVVGHRAACRRPLWWRPILRK